MPALSRWGKSGGDPCLGFDLRRGLSCYLMLLCAFWPTILHAITTLLMISIHSASVIHSSFTLSIYPPSLIGSFDHHYKCSRTCAAASLSAACPEEGQAVCRQPRPRTPRRVLTAPHRIKGHLLPPGAVISSRDCVWNCLFHYSNE